MKKIALLGSTGSIGRQTLDVVRNNKDRFTVIALTCGRNIELFRKQIEEFKPKMCVTELEEDAILLSKEYRNIDFSFGMEGLIKVSKESNSDMLVNALMGMRGLEPTYYAIKAGKDIALANKETLVAGGEVILDALKNQKYLYGEDRNIRLLPIDSEHSAIFQCLEGNENRKVKKILLTCSGGPFRGKTLNELKNVTLEDALKHPKWNMGKKITIDSATLMNKGLEVIEAKWLFDVPVEDIEVLVHPQSIVHSGVEFIDNSILTQMGVPDMRIPISLALGYPDRLANKDQELDLFSSTLTFEKPDLETFKCLKLAYDAISKGGSYPVVMNAANEVLVDKFLAREIGFLDIQNTLERTLNEHVGEYNLSLEDVLRIDKRIRDSLR